MSWGRAREGGGVRGISPKKILYFQTPVETILMHFGTIFTHDEALLIYDESMSWSKTMNPECYYSQDLPC